MKKTINDALPFLKVIALLIVLCAFMYTFDNTDFFTELLNVQASSSEYNYKNLIFAKDKIVALGVYYDDIDTYTSKYIKSKKSIENFSLNGDDLNLLVIPKDDTIKISVYSSTINDDGEVIKLDKLLDNYNKPFTASICDFEYVPSTIITITDSEGNESDIELTYSGLDGTLVLPEDLVIDISNYSNDYISETNE